MASHPRSREREEQRRLSMRTLAIASVASASAAAVTSQFSTQGTWVAAALTPVVVTLVSEMLHRPTERIAERLTTDRPRVLADAMGAGAPPQREEEPPVRRAPAEPGAGREPGPADTRPAAEHGEPLRVYRRPARRKLAVGLAVATAALAFAVAAVAITIPELIAGESIGKGDRKTSLFGGKDRNREQEEAPTQTAPEEEQQQREEAPEEQPQGEQQREPERTQPQQTTPQQTETTPEAPPAEPAP